MDYTQKQDKVSSDGNSRGIDSSQLFGEIKAFFSLTVNIRQQGGRKKKQHGKVRSNNAFLFKPTPIGAHITLLSHFCELQKDSCELQKHFFPQRCVLYNIDYISVIRILNLR